MGGAAALHPHRTRPQPRLDETRTAAAPGADSLGIEAATLGGEAPQEVVDVRFRPIAAEQLQRAEKSGAAATFPEMRQIVLLRGINLGSRNRVPMPALRELLEDRGFGDVRTYLQSGNVVLSGKGTAKRLASECKRAIAEGLGLDIDVLVRTRDELAEIVARNPLGKVAVNPKRYQVTFLSAKIDQTELERLVSLATKDERIVAHGRELYAWHPNGVARSRLWARLAGQGLGVSATSRNWTTVEALLEMADA
jgi:uncharacterized protein (DUF1697 family)